MKDLKLVYYAKIKKDKDGYTSTLRDFDNVFSEGDSFDECLYNTQEALEGMLLCMLNDKEQIPKPTHEPELKEVPIYIKPEIAAPVLLQHLRNMKHKSMSEVARTMNVPYQRYQRLENYNNMTLKSLDKAVMALGGEVEIIIHA